MQRDSDAGIIGTMELDEVTIELLEAYFDHYCIRNLSEHEKNLVANNLPYLVKKFNFKPYQVVFHDGLIKCYDVQYDGNDKVGLIASLNFDKREILQYDRFNHGMVVDVIPVVIAIT